MRNSLLIEWDKKVMSNGKLRDSFRRVATEAQAEDILFARQVANMKSAIWYDNDGVEHKLLPKNEPKS